MIKRILFIFMLLFSHLSVSAGVTDLKLSTAQIFDVQWSISGGRLYASGFNYIYSSVNYATQTNSAARWTLAQTQDAGANGRYIGFFNSTTNPGTYGMAVFNSDGTRYKIINNTGSFRALADGAIFYNGNGMWGTLITTGQGYNNGQSGNWAVTQDNPNNTQLQAYTPPSSTPLAAGQTAAPAAPAGPTIEGGTITQTNAPANQTITSGGGSSAGPTVPQTTRYNAWNNGVQATDNYLYIDQVSGNYNTVNITQSGVKNTMDIGINGSSNTINATQTGQNYLNALVQSNTNSVTSFQTNTSGTNYQETKIISGNNNTINVTQKDNGNKLMFNTVTGSNNSISAVQEGSGNHYLENKLTGSGNSVLANQLGATGNKANIDLTNAGGAASVDLQQSGGKSFTLIQSCANPSGCTTVVRQ